MSEIPEGVETSIALGDLPSIPGSVAMAVKGCAQLEPDYTKIGLKGPETVRQAQKVLEASVRAASDSRTSVIAAAYADHGRSNSIKPEEALEAAREAGCDGIMIDTLNKGSANIFEAMSEERLQAFAQRCSEEGLFSAIAGSVRISHADKIDSIEPDAVGVRGAVCSGERTSTMDKNKVKKFVNTI
jgi:Uncharacterized protein conserved in archaea